MRLPQESGACIDLTHSQRYGLIKLIGPDDVVLIVTILWGSPMLFCEDSSCALNSLALPYIERGTDTLRTIILAAGYSTRLYPLTKDKPKALLPVAGNP